MVEFTTERLVLRPWTEEDAEVLYELVKDPKVGPITGWLPHTSLEESRKILKEVLMNAETWAVILKESGQVIGDISLFSHSHTDTRKGEKELGCWLGSAYWGHGYMPEAAACLLQYGFEDLKLSGIWAGCYEGNRNSSRVMEKIGMTFHHHEADKEVPLLNIRRDEDWYYISYEKWLKNVMGLTFEPFRESDVERMTAIMKRAFDADSMESAGHPDGPPGYDDGSFLRKYALAENSDAWKIIKEGKTIGLIILFAGQNPGHLGCLFVDPEYHSKGIGQMVWNRVERQYPEIAVWETETPLISRRNLHFYVNKLGFVIYRIEDIREKENAFVCLRKQTGKE